MKMRKTERLNLALDPNTIELLNSFSKDRGYSKTKFLEEMLFVLSLKREDSHKMKDFFGASLYEKYFKN